MKATNQQVLTKCAEIAVYSWSVGVCMMAIGQFHGIARVLLVLVTLLEMGWVGYLLNSIVKND